MYSFKYGDMVANICRRSKSQTTYQSGAEIGYDISLQIGEYHHIETIGAGNQFHTEIIYDHIISFQFRELFGHFMKTFQKKTIGDLHDIGFVSAGNASGSFFASHLECISDYLFAAGTSNESTAECHVVRQHVFDTAIGVFDVFPYDGEIDRNARFGKNGIHSVESLENTFIGVGVPGFRGP